MSTATRRLRRRLTVLTLTVGAFVSGALPARADVLRVTPASLEPGRTWTEIVFSGARGLPRVGSEGGVFWDLRLAEGTGTLVRWTVLEPADAGLTSTAERLGADVALCAEEVASGRQLGCRLVRSSETRPSGPVPRWSDLPGDAPTSGAVQSTRAAATPIEAGVHFEETTATSTTLVRGVAEGVALLPGGPREVVLLREDVVEPSRTLQRYRFLTRGGEVAAVFEGPLPAIGEPFVPERGTLLVAAAADDGIEIGYQALSDALVPGATGFLQYSQENLAALDAVHPDWADIPSMISIDASGVSYQPDPTDPSTSATLPEVWDFTGLQSGTLTYRTFNTTRDDLAGNVCAEVCSLRDVGPNPPDGTWQAYLKIDNYDRAGTFLTRDIFDLNDNDTGANPSIDVPYVAQNELNVDNGRTQICFAQSAGGADRLLRFFQFTGPDPASAVLGFGDSWASGNWTSCNNENGLRLTATQLCANACYPECSPVSPRARGLLPNDAGFFSTIVEDGWVHLPTGNFVQALLMRQDTDVEAGADFFGTCNLSPTRNRAFDYFWLHEDYGLLALVSSPADTTITAEDWSAVSNQTDGADFTWGPFPPWQSQADACLSGTRVSWALPADGSNLGGSPGIADYGYVVSWGSAADPDVLADWNGNPNHTPLPGDAGYLAAPAGTEPTSTVITGWAGSSINATVVTALRYTDPDAGDQTTYASPAFYKVVADPAGLDALTFGVGDAVAPFVTRAGPDLSLSWPTVAGAASYQVRVYDLDTKLEIACPAGLDCAPAGPSTIHVGGTAAGNHGYRVLAVDPCGESSTN